MNNGTDDSGSTRRTALTVGGATAMTLAGCSSLVPSDDGNGEEDGNETANDESDDAGVFEVTGFEPQSGDGEVAVEWTVENTGEQEGTKPVRFVADGEETDSETATLAPGESASGRFATPVDNPQQNSVTVGVRTDDDENGSAFSETFDPVSLVVTWQRDPTTTATVDWHIEKEAEWPIEEENEGEKAEEIDREPVLEYRAAGTDDAWQTVVGDRQYDPAEEFHPDADTDYDRAVHRAELAGLEPATAYEFRFGTAPTWTVETLPATLDEPLTFANGGDTDHDNWNPILDALLEHDPAFLTIGGDLPYANGGAKSDSTELWHSWFASVKERLVDESGQVLPVVCGIGNHECRIQVFAAVNLSRHVSLENVESGSGNEVLDADFAGDPAEARRNWAPYFYTFFDTFPGERGYDVLDVGDYLSIVMLDTYHSNAVYGDQTEWLDTTLQERRDVEHVFPHLHTPIYPSHRDENQVYTRHIQDAWRPLLEREEIPITFGHHDHTTKLTPPLLDGEIDEENGLVEIGDGCMGRGPREPDPEREWIEQAEAANCVNIVTIDGETERVQTIGKNNDTLQEIEREVR